MTTSSCCVFVHFINYSRLLQVMQLSVVILATQFHCLVTDYHTDSPLTRLGTRSTWYGGMVTGTQEVLVSWVLFPWWRQPGRTSQSGVQWCRYPSTLMVMDPSRFPWLALLLEAIWRVALHTLSFLSVVTRIDQLIVANICHNEYAWSRKYSRNQIFVKRKTNTKL